MASGVALDTFIQRGRAFFSSLKKTPAYDLELTCGKVLRIENRINRSIPIYSTALVFQHSSLFKLLKPIEGIIEEKSINYINIGSKAHSQTLAYLGAVLLRSMLVLEKYSEASLLLSMMLKAGLLCDSLYYSLLYFLLVQSTTVTKLPLHVSPAFGLAILFSETSSLPSIENTFLALQILKAPNQQGILFLLYKNLVLLSKQYQYDPECISLLLEHATKQNYFSFIAFLLSEIDIHFSSPHVSNTCMTKTANVNNISASLNQQLVEYFFNGSGRRDLLEEHWGSLSTGQVPIIVFKQIIYKLISYLDGRKSHIANNGQQFFSTLIISLLRRLSLSSSFFVTSFRSNSENSYLQFLDSILKFSVNQQSLEIISCLIYRISSGERALGNENSLNFDQFNLISQLLRNQNQVSIINYWRRAAIASGNLDFVFEQLPEPNSHNEIQDTVTALGHVDPEYIEQRLGNRLESFGWFHVYFLLMKFPLHSEKMQKLFSLAKKLNFTNNADHWKVVFSTFASSDPSYVWYVIENSNEVRNVLSPTIDTLQVVLDSIFASATFSRECLEKTFVYVQSLINQPNESCTSPLFLLQLKSVLLAHLSRLYDSLLTNSDLASKLAPDNFSSVLQRIFELQKTVESWFLELT